MFEIKEFINRKAGDFKLGIIFISIYIAMKYFKTGLTGSLVYYSGWFVLIVIAALVADLFEKTESWIYYSLRDIETNKKLSDEERLIMIKNQLQIAVDQHLTIFLMVNGFDKFLERLRLNFKKIYTGVISVKEMLVIMLYMFYDIIIKGGTLDILNPYDSIIIIICAVILKMIDATKGASSIIAKMYQEINSDRKSDVRMNALCQYIKQLAYKFGIIYDDVQEKELNCSILSNATLEKYSKQIQNEINSRPVNNK